MATSTGQRIGIWIIAGALTLGTLGGFAAMILQPSNSKKDQEAQLKTYAESLKKQQAQQNAAAVAHAASSRPLDGFSAEPFDSPSVTKLTVDTLTSGDGVAVSKDSTIEANYFGWTSDGKIFDSSNQDGTTTSATFSLKSVIEGWTNGLDGVRVGSTVKLTIPAVQAYGATGSLPNIGPNEPLQFIVEVKSIK